MKFGGVSFFHNSHLYALSNDHSRQCSIVFYNSPKRFKYVTVILTCVRHVFQWIAGDIHSPHMGLLRFCCGLNTKNLNAVLAFR